MKTSTLLKSFLLAAGLLLAGTSAVNAGDVYTIIVRDGDLHRHAHDHPYRSCSHSPVVHTGHHYFRDYGQSHHGKLHGDHLGRHDDRGDKAAYSRRWHYGKSDDRVDDKRHWQRSRSAGIGYTGRS